MFLLHNIIQPWGANTFPFKAMRTNFGLNLANVPKFMINLGITLKFESTIHMMYQKPLEEGHLIV